MLNTPIVLLVLLALCTISHCISESFVNVIDSQKTFDDISISKAEFSSNFGSATKFLIDMRSTPTIYYINSRLPGDHHKYHYDFASKYIPTFNLTLDEFNKVTYFTQDKQFFAGTLQAYEYKGKNILGYQFYPQDVVHERTLVKPSRLIRETIKLQTQLSFVATGNQQTIINLKKEFHDMNIYPLTMQDILGDVRYSGVVTGTTYGYLRMLPEDETETEFDIVVLNDLPLYLSVVSGVITTTFQDPSSHVSLKSRERGTPDCYYKDAMTDKNLLSLVNKPVQMNVTNTRVILTLSTDQQVADFHKEKKHDPIVMTYDNVTRHILHYDEMCSRSRDFADAKQCLAKKTTYGAKSANLAFLSLPIALGRKHEEGTPSSEFQYDLSPIGFSIPFAQYDDFINHPDNTRVKQSIQQLQSDMDENKLSKVQLQQAVLNVQELIYRATIPSDNWDRIWKAIDKLVNQLPDDIDPEDIKLKFRSSASAEDIENFDGAGLYTSFAAKIHNDKKGKCKFVKEEEEMSPKRVDCAILGVYASLYNVRAMEERKYAHITGGIAMAIAVVPSYSTKKNKVAANSVVVTKIQEAIQGDVAGYTVASQVGNLLVTNPDRGTLSEMTWGIEMERGEAVSFTTIRHAVPVAGQPALDRRVLTDQQMLDTVKLVQGLEVAYCNAKMGKKTRQCDFVPFYPTSDKQKSLDLEFKYMEDGKYVIKQIREFAG